MLDSAKLPVSRPWLFLLGSLLHAAFNLFNHDGSILIELGEPVVVLIISCPLGQPEEFLSVFPGMLEPVGP